MESGKSFSSIVSRKERQSTVRLQAAASLSDSRSNPFGTTLYNQSKEVQAQRGGGGGGTVVIACCCSGGASKRVD